MHFDRKPKVSRQKLLTKFAKTILSKEFFV